MGYWSQFDEDSTRLPPGLRRIGYDADTATYTYEDSDGIRYEGAPCCEYGVLTKTESSTPARRIYSSRSNALHSSFKPRSSTPQNSAERSPAEKTHTEKSTDDTAQSPKSSFSSFEESKENSLSEFPPWVGNGVEHDRENRSAWSLRSIARLL
ncbi:hypothetical protein Egran_06112, partial [Elaphomyces granulatus]